MQYISEEEKKNLFDRIEAIEVKVDNFIDEAKDKINSIVEEINKIKK